MTSKQLKYTALNNELGESVSHISEQEMKSRYKILFLGNEASGKTSLVSRFLDNEFSEEYTPTVGMDFKSDTLFLGGSITKLKIFDASGHQKFRSLIPQYIRDSDVIVITYDITSKDSFAAVETWITTVEEVRPLNEILLVLVGTKLDIERDRVVPDKDGKDFAKRHNAMFMETSARSGDNCKDLFHTIAKQLAPRDSDQKDSSALMKELDELEDDYFGEEEEQSFCCKLCCCLGVLCPCLAFLCKNGKNGTKTHDVVMQDVDESPSPPPRTQDNQHQVFTIDPEEQLEDLDLEDSP
mmetsp:Transcript_19319/g.36364  ORF Transcript_19319/g.36364 Transcript_19319/m.36364 type:complete len:297 (-) Transcript_19319:215-1105(-)